VSFFAGAVLFSFLINGLFLKFSRNLGTRNTNEEMVRWSAQTKPAFGGISFYMVFLLSVASFSFFFLRNDYFLNLSFLGMFISITLGFLMGLADDSYNTKVWIKFITQLACAFALILTGTYIHLFNNIYIDYFITIIWVVGMMNSINMLDNMDAITTTVSLFILTAILIKLLIFKDFDNPSVFLLLGLIGALSGFYYYNWNPSRMYMGDTGSQFLGVFLAIYGILFFWNSKNSNHIEDSAYKQIIVTIVMFSLPIIDTTTVFIKRIRNGKSPFVGGKDHTTHHLSYLGLSDRKVAIVYALISTMSLTLSVIACLIINWSWIYTVLYAFYFLTLFVILFYIANKNIKYN
jgi:UDP-GlcNAc:undecaprenyl-phosphate GlcNAc-1-phosphate transferase